MPYRLDHQMAISVQKPPLPPPITELEFFRKHFEFNPAFKSVESTRKQSNRKSDSKLEKFSLRTDWLVKRTLEAQGFCEFY